MFFALEGILLYGLHSTMVDDEIQRQIEELAAKGESHREALQEHFTTTTMQHVLYMEENVPSEVMIIQRSDKRILATSVSSPDRILSEDILYATYEEATIVEDDWENAPYLVTATPLNENVTVLMIEPTEIVQQYVQQLSQHFLYIAFAGILITPIVILLLSHWITKPLLQMQEATKQMSQGNFSVGMNTTGSDELSLLAQSIEDLAYDLAQHRRLRSLFLASVSHELRTPLTYIQGYAQIAQKTATSKERRNYALSIIQEETERVELLLQDLFMLAKVDSNQFSIQKEKLHVKGWLHKVLSPLQLVFEEEGRALIEEVDEDRIVSIDSERVQQMLVNVIDNAKKYSTEGPVKVRFTSKGHTYRLEVIDVGPGIPKEVLSQIGQPYLHATTPPSSKHGLGLGLAIVTSIAKAHGIQFTFHTNDPKGTIARFEWEENR